MARRRASEGGFGETAGLEHPSGSAAWQLQFTAPQAGDYEIGIDGSFRSRLELLVDGQEVASDRNVLQWPSNYEPLATVRLPKGVHRLEFRYDGPDVDPGSAGIGYFGLGPVIVGRTGPRPARHLREARGRALALRQDARLGRGRPAGIGGRRTPGSARLPGVRVVRGQLRTRLLVAEV